MKMPKFTQLISRPRRKKLHATATARRGQSLPDNYDDDEPQTRLSSAFIVVLILHVVAVGGIYAFNSIKAHRKSREVVAATVAPAVVKQTQSSAATVPAPRTERIAAALQSPGEREPDPAPVASQPVAKRSSRPTPVATPKASSGKSNPPASYVVAKGDNLVGIARKLRVSYAELLKVNNIEDPDKLQVGRSLKVPQTKKTN